jgi:hypothetical protein
MITKKICFSCCLCSLLWWGCKKPFDEIDTSTQALNPEFAVPLLNTSMEMGEFMSGLKGEGALVLNNDGAYTLNYQGTLLSNPPLRLFETLVETPSIPITDANLSVSFPTPSGLKITQMSFKSGSIKWKMAAAVDAATVNLSIPQLIDNQGIAFKKTFIITKNTLEDSVILRGLFLKPINGKIQFITDIKDAAGKKVSLKEGSLSMSKYDPQVVQGVLVGREIVIPKSTIQFDFFKNWKPQGEVRFLNPKITTSFDNAYGLPTRVFMDIFEVETMEGKTIVLKSPLTKLPNGSNNALKPAFLTLQDLGKTKKTVYEFNTSNANINDLFNTFPSAFNFSNRAVIGDSLSEGFFTDTSSLKMKVDISVPMTGTAKGFVRENTEGVDFSSYEKVTDVELKIITNNNMPFELNIQGYFLDKFGNMIDSLAQKPSLILRGASVNANGSVARPSEETNFIKIEAERFKRLINAKKIVLQYTFATASNGTVPVKMLRSQSVTLMIGLKGKIKY